MTMPLPTECTKTPRNPTFHLPDLSQNMEYPDKMDDKKNLKTRSPSGTGEIESGWAAKKGRAC